MRMGMKRRRRKIWFIILPLIIASMYFTALRLEPSFVALARAEANKIINSAVNEQIADTFSVYTSDMLYTKTDDAFISDTAAINTLKADIINGLYDRLAENGGKIIKIPLGSASGLYLLNGLGPDIPVKISPARSVSADFEDSFESAGINFVKHTLYLTISVDVNYRGFALNEHETVTACIPVTESVKSGSVPDYYGSMGFIGGNNSDADF